MTSNKNSHDLFNFESKTFHVFDVSRNKEYSFSFNEIESVTFNIDKSTKIWNWLLLLIDFILFTDPEPDSEQNTITVKLLIRELKVFSLKLDSNSIEILNSQLEKNKALIPFKVEIRRD